MKIIPLGERMEFIEELAALHHSEWGHLNPSLTLEKRIAKLTSLTGEGGVPSIFIATSGNELIGSAALVLEDMQSRPDLSPWLAAVYVKEKYRSHGAASALVAQCEYQAKRSKVDTLYLYTEFASKLYERLGWQILESCIYRGISVNIMYKKI